MASKRIWELDAFRGLCLLGVVAVHFLYDLTELFGIIRWSAPAWFVFVQNWGGVVFLVLSGICVTLGSRSLRRGAIVLACGLLITAVTWGMYAFLEFDRSIIIYFGVLHCLGVCMLLWPVFRRCPWWLLAILGIILVALGFWADTKPVETPWLFPLGFVTQEFASSDYFPLLPNLGFFLLGAALGRTLYGKKQSLFPSVNEKNLIVRPLCFCGRHSLWIYLLHQPILAGICMLL